MISDKPNRRLVLIDGYALLHRAFHAMPELTTSKGERVEAIYGFLRMLLKVIGELKPTDLAVAFDRPEPTFRHKLYPPYQAKRPPMDESLKSQAERLQQVIGAMEIPAYELDGFEADDLLGTLAYQADQEKAETFIVTGDRDILQLVKKNSVKVYMPKKGLSSPIVWDRQVFQDKYGFEPEKLVDFKALVGDPADNYPGVLGIGDKTAAKLLAKYSSLDKIYQHLDELDERVKKNLVKGKKDALMSKKLAQIHTDLPVRLDWKKVKMSRFNSEEVIRVFEKLEFGTLLKQILEYSPEKPAPEKEKSDQLELLE